MWIVELSLSLFDYCKELITVHTKFLEAVGTEESMGDGLLSEVSF